MNLVQAIWRLEELQSRCHRGHATADCEDGEAISLVLDELKIAINCPGCNGQGRRWYALHGIGTCDECKGSGKRR